METSVGWKIKHLNSQYFKINSKVTTVHLKNLSVRMRLDTF